MLLMRVGWWLLVVGMMQSGHGWGGLRVVVHIRSVAFQVPREARLTNEASLVGPLELCHFSCRSTEQRGECILDHRRALVSQPASC